MTHRANSLSAIHKTIVLIVFIFAYSGARSQSIDFANGFVVIGDTANQVSYTYGLLFYSQDANSIEVAAGVQQAQLLLAEITADTCQNEPYDQLGFNISAAENATPGDYDYNSYTRSHLNYDSITTLHLIIFPVYEVNDTLLTFSRGSYDLGNNDLTYTSVHDCDSIVHLMVYELTCPADFEHTMTSPGIWTYDVPGSLAPTYAPDDGNVAISSSHPSSTYRVGETTPVVWTSSIAGDTLLCNQEVIINYYVCPVSTSVGGDTYEVTRVGVDCWTKTNLKTLEYSDGTAVPAPMVFENEAYNLTHYGRLYTWEDATRNGAVNLAGYVQGICPDGWHIPSDLKYQELLNLYNDDELKSSSALWLPEPGNNASTFSALPGGRYSGESGNYEHIRVKAYFWSASEDGTTNALSCVLAGHCDEAGIVPYSRTSALSVRCIKD